MFTLRLAMYVCLCQAVTESDIREAASSGTRDLETLGESLGVGAACGCCREAAQTVIDEHLAASISRAA